MRRFLAAVLIFGGVAVVAGSLLPLPARPGDTAETGALPPSTVASPSQPTPSPAAPSTTSGGEQSPSPPAPAPTPPTDPTDPTDATGNPPAETGMRRLPVGLRIASLGVDAPVEPYGVDASGQMDVPANVTDVAWYEYGPSPGEPGSAVLAAHVDLAGQGPGVFFQLREMEAGDLIEVAYEDGTQTTFRVVARVRYGKSELPLDAIFAREGPPVLTLITCGGSFNRTSRSYDSNDVVYAVPLGGEFAPLGGSA